MGKVMAILIDDLKDGDEIITIEPYKVKNKQDIEMMKESIGQKWLYGKLPRIDKKVSINQDRLLVD